MSTTAAKPLCAGRPASLIRCFAPQLGAKQARRISDCYQRLIAPDFAELAECEVRFSPHTMRPTDQKLILGGVNHQKLKNAEAALRMKGRLQIGPARQFWRDGGKQ